LYDGHPPERLGARASEIVAGTEAERTFARRLAEAQAIGAASSGLPNRHPALSARDGLSVWQRLFGWTYVAGYLTALCMATAATLAITIAALAAIFLLLIGIRLMAAAFALTPKRPPRAHIAAAGDLPV